jgi:heat shock transcription factor 1
MRSDHAILCLLLLFSLYHPSILDGFHKLSTVENGTMDSDKDEIQFSHPFFLKDQPELLRNIKRKVCMTKRDMSRRNDVDSQATTSKSSNENSNKHDELTKVLTDVKQLRGRQASVDSQLNAMKQENALLWREIAILRQKHLKQQKIVNKVDVFFFFLVRLTIHNVLRFKLPYISACKTL